MDGVDTRDPEGGSAWTFFNQNLIQEIQIGGLGAPAEYGGFTGAIINTVTKSGTQRVLRPVLDALHQRLAGERTTSVKSYLTANPTLGDSAVVTKLVDYTVQVGGPLKRDKAFFFGSVQRYSQNQNPAGPVANADRHQSALQHEVHAPADGDRHVDPRNAVRLLQPDTAASATGPRPRPAINQTVTEDAPEWVWNAQ